MNRAPDPQKYNMYAAFRTKERGEKKAREKRESVYELNRPKQGTQKAAQMRTQDPSADVYRVLRTSARPTQSTQQNVRGATHANAPVRHSTPHAASARTQSTPSSDTTQKRVPLRKAPQAQAAQVRELSPVRSTAHAAAQKIQKKPPLSGTRVTNQGEDAYRYGFHSSYRTADGRILDGFDKTGRPIYREGGAAAVVRHVENDVDVAKLHPVRRIRVETLVDTKKKPFPYMLVFIMVCCTALIMGMLYSYMRLNECTNTLSTLNYRLSLLRSETNTLTAEVVRREDLIAIEQTAAETLGMVKNDVLTKRYVSIENEDKTEIFGTHVEDKDEHDIVKIDLKTGEILIEETTKEVPSESKETDIREDQSENTAENVTTPAETEGASAN